MASRIIDVDYYAGGDRKVVTSVDVYKSIRALQLEGVTSQRAAAKILGISRNTVKKYWMGDAVPWDRKAYQREASVITPEVMNYRNLENRIDGLDTDTAEGVKKQRHTARRIYNRLVEEFGYTGSESAIRAAVHEAKAERKETVLFDTNYYSIPCKYKGKDTTVKAYPNRVEIWINGLLVATRDRCMGRKQESLDLRHYLPILERKGRAIRYARPVLNAVPTEFLKWMEKQHLNSVQMANSLRFMHPSKFHRSEFGGGCGERPLLFDIELSVNSKSCTTR